jgi:hypothetical protein
MKLSIFFLYGLGIYACPNSIDMVWDDPDRAHNYTLSLTDLYEKLEACFNRNARPPFKEAFFVHKLPIQLWRRLKSECLPMVLLVETLVMVFEALTNDRFEEAWNDYSQISDEDRILFGQVWPLEKALKMHQTRSSNITADSNNTVAIVICHCNEDLSWLFSRVSRIPPKSSLFVYEKCGNDSLPFLKDAEAEEVFNNGVHVIPQLDGPVRGDECTAYLKYIVDEYHILPDWTVFLQADAGRHLFFAFLSLTLGAIGRGTYEVPFLHLNFHRHYQTTTPCMRDVERLLFNLSDPVDGVPLIGTYCCAQFVVSRDRILSRTIDFYAHALSMVDGSIPDICSPVPPRRSSHCYVLEYLWHVVFGENRKLPFRPDDVSLPIFLRLKYGSEHAKTRWDDVVLAKNSKRVINRSVEEC